MWWLLYRWDWDGGGQGLSRPQQESVTLNMLSGHCCRPLPWDMWFPGFEAWNPLLCVFSFQYLKPELDSHPSEAGFWDVLSVMASPLRGPVFMAPRDNDNFLSPKFIPCPPCAFSCSDFPARLILVSLARWSFFMEPQNSTPKSSTGTPVTLFLEMASKRTIGPKHKTLGQSPHSLGML